MDVLTIADCPQDQGGIVLGGLGDEIPQFKNKVFTRIRVNSFLKIFKTFFLKSRLTPFLSRLDRKNPLQCWTYACPKDNKHVFDDRKYAKSQGYPKS